MSVRDTPMGLISSDPPKQRIQGGLRSSGLDIGYSVEMERNQPVSEEIYARLREAAFIEIDFAGEKSFGKSRIRLMHHGPLSWYSVKDISRKLTAEFDCPILVLPKTKYGDEIPSEPMTGEYRQFEAHVVLVRTESDKSAIFEMATCHERGHKDPDTGIYQHDAFVLAFPGETVLKSWYKPELSFPIARHVYSMQHKKVNFIGYSDAPLELGQVYRVGGLMFHAGDKKNTKATPFQEAYMLIDWAVPVRKTVDINQGFLDKFKGLTHDQIRNSVAFPFENSMRDYKELPFIAVFYIRSGTIPFNVFMVGKPGCSKSAFLKRLAAISGDVYVDGGAATLKGIMPSFSPKAPQVGVLGSSRYFALINEFLHIVKGGDKTEAPYNVLGTLKNILEGEKTHVPSGIGNMDIKMRSSAFMASNWIELGRGGRLSSINDFYGRMDPALLDRFFLYPVSQKAQMKMVDQHSERVKDLFKAYEVATGCRDEIEIMEKMPSPYPLHTYDLRTILLFKEQLTSRMEKEAIKTVNEAVARIRQKYTYERYTRVRDNIANIASAKAFERALREGTVKPDTKEIFISQEDVKEAAEMIDLVFSYYDGRVENEKTARKEFYQVSATSEQKFIIDTLKDRYKEGLTRETCSMPLDQMCDSFKARYGEMDWSLQLFPLLTERMVAYDGMNLIWLPDGMEDGLVHSLFVGDSQRDFVSTENLRRLHLLDSSLHSGWIAVFPMQPTEVVQKLVRELCVQSPMKIGELKYKAGLNAEVIENAISYLHLSGELWHTDKGYLLRKR